MFIQFISNLFVMCLNPIRTILAPTGPMMMISRSPWASYGEKPQHTNIALSARTPYQRPWTSQIRVRVQVWVQQLQHNALVMKFKFPSLSSQQKGTGQCASSPWFTGVGVLVCSVHACPKNLVFHGSGCEGIGREPLCCRLFHVYKKGLILRIFTTLMLWSNPSPFLLPLHFLLTLPHPL